jgi:hypothetical protein
MDGKSMRYNHESYLPIGAFQPILGRMTLHGGGGGFISDVVESVSDFIAPVTDVINDVFIQPASDILAASDDYITQPITAPISQVTSALDDAVIQPITEPIGKVGVAIDDAVADVIPGGWGTLAQIAAAAATAGQSLAVQAAAAAAAGAGSDFAKNKDIKSAVEQGAIKGATRYGLGTLGEMMSGPTDVLSADDAYMGQAMNNLSSTAATVPEGAVTSLVPEATVQSASYGASQVPFDTDVPVYYDGYVPMTADQVAASNPTLYPEVQINATNAANAANVAPDPISDLLNSRQNLAISDQANLDAAYTPSYDVNAANAAIRDQANLDNKYTFAGEDKLKNILKDPTGYATEKAGDVKDYLANKALVTERYLTNTPLSEMPGDLYNAAKDYYNNASKTDLAMLAAGAYGLSNLAGGSEEQPQTQAEADAAAKKTYTYGTAGPMSPNYLLKNRVNAGNVYSNATGYKPLTRYADGGEVEHFRKGGIKGLEDLATRITQPFEKAILRPVGEAAPFLKDMAPYAGIAAGAMVGNPAIAAGIGGLASGFGKPGGFDMKRALMGGIAAYGMSNLGAGIEAAGQTPLTDSAALPFESYPDPQNQMGGFYGPSGQTNQLPAANPTFRNPDVMKQGISNLLENSNTSAYKDAMSGLTSKAGVYSAGLPLIMGTTGMMGVDESNALKQEYDKSMATSQAEADKYNARVAAGKKRAQQAVSENPYMFADGGVINPPDDQTGMPNQTPMQKFEYGGMYNYADGGPVSYEQYLGSQGYRYIPSQGGDDAPRSGWARDAMDGDANYYVDFLGGENEENIQRAYQRDYPQTTQPSEADRAAAIATAQSQTSALNQQMQDASDRMNAELAKSKPVDHEAALRNDELVRVRENARKALEMSQNVMGNITDATTAVNTAQDLIGMPTVTAPPPPPPPVVTTPDPVAPIPDPVAPTPVAPTPPPPPVVTEPIAPTPSPRTTAPTAANPTGQYLVSNPTASSPLSSSNIYEYQKKRRGRGFAEGGLPRFLSGGGDGMSDSIRANIEGSQEARLADGEFVIPADVVSHLGNGSSKAGAKQLYDMMDRVRKARTGNPKQGREIKPTKFMPV